MDALSDLEGILSFYDGKGGKALRVPGLQSDVDVLNLSIIGGADIFLLIGLT